IFGLADRLGLLRRRAVGLPGRRLFFFRPPGLRLVFVTRLRWNLIAQRQRVGRGVAAAMGDADQHLANAALLDDVASAAAEADYRPPAAVVADFDIAPANAFPPAGAQGFEDR